ncbi:hypothetical protein QFW96_20885 [Saccharopolyspora sp. TS4A08]|uniref:WxL domain-containing protein n=1 Tax=Saccharopolyspora ipomoeae TaxID=3042027 RepID=A0ABT6PSW2_9PSEU|nr:hypothetical protein [Saccharopolyspora sp. TS4A08]MDI2031100.1 hypothetical protein [Saccharopolyspora sp. TS4A08]
MLRDVRKGREMRRVVLGTTAALLVVGATPAYAVDTAVTFTVQGAALTVAGPANASLPSASIGAPTSGPLGTVTVSDQRGVVPAPWTSTVNSTDFVTGASGPSETIPNGNISYASGPATSTAGAGTFTPGQPTTGDAVPLDTAKTAFSHVGGGGANTAGWNPRLTVNVPPTAAQGTYTGTVTHSVA